MRPRRASCRRAPARLRAGVAARVRRAAAQRLLDLPDRHSVSPAHAGTAFLSFVSPSCSERRAASTEQSDRRRDLAVRQVGHVAQHDRRALTLGQRADRLPQPSLARQQLLLGARRRALVRPRAIAPILLGDRLRSSSAGAVRIECLVLRDRQHPRAQVRLRAQARVSAQRRDERLLKAVLRLGRADLRHEVAPHDLAFGVEEALEGGRPFALSCVALTPA